MVAAAAVTLLLLPQAAEAKKFRYAAGPRVPEDTVLSVAQPELDPIVRKRGPRVPLTNLQLTSMVANTAFDSALDPAPLQQGTRVLVAPAGSHPLNFAVEHAVLLHMSKRGIVSTVRRSLIPDDSLQIIATNPGEPVLEYTLASARITYLRLTGWLPGRVNIERQALVEGTLTLRDPRTSSVLWVGEARYNLVDRFRRQQLPLVEDERFTDLKGAPPTRNLNKVLEPVVVVAVVTGLVALFFQNRP
jgi:hypothetical protein